MHGSLRVRCRSSRTRPEDFARWNLHILGEGAVEVRRHPDVVHGVVTLRAHARSTITRFPGERVDPDPVRRRCRNSRCPGSAPRGRLVPAAVLTVNRAVGSAGDSIGGGLDVGAVPTGRVLISVLFMPAARTLSRTSRLRESAWAPAGSRPSRSRRCRGSRRRSSSGS